MLAPCRKIVGLILAGGEAKRFGGGKCLARLRGLPLIHRVYRHLRTSCDEVWLSVRELSEASIYHLPVTKVVADRAPGQGPLRALVEALKLLGPEDLLLLAACDQPFLSEALLRYFVFLAQAAPEEALVCVEESGRLLPLPGLYRPRLLKGKGEGPSFRSFLEGRRVRRIPPEEWQRHDPKGLSFFNINYQEDLKEAERLLKEQP